MLCLSRLCVSRAAQASRLSRSHCPFTIEGRSVNQHCRSQSDSIWPRPDTLWSDGSASLRRIRLLRQKRWSDGESGPVLPTNWRFVLVKMTKDLNQIVLSNLHYFHSPNSSEINKFRLYWVSVLEQETVCPQFTVYSETWRWVSARWLLFRCRSRLTCLEASRQKSTVGYLSAPIFVQVLNLYCVPAQNILQVNVV